MSALLQKERYMNPLTYWTYNRVISVENFM